MELKEVNWDRIQELCPQVLPGYFLFLKDNPDRVLQAGIIRYFRIPFSELPMHINKDISYGVIRGIVLYRLEVGK